MNESPSSVADQWPVKRGIVVESVLKETPCLNRLLYDCIRALISTATV